jgi:hypothetical protein
MFLVITIKNGLLKHTKKLEKVFCAVGAPQNKK